MTEVLSPAPPVVPAQRDARSLAEPASDRPVAALLTVAAVALVLTHWLRLLPLGYAAPGATRWEDFADLLTPYVVAGPLLGVLARAGAGGRTWVFALTGAALFVQGHGVHLSANSISYAQGDAAPTHLWDEVVGHALWFLGLTLLTVAVTHAVRRLPVPAGPVAVALTGAVAVTWAANVVEGGHAVLGSVLAAVLVGSGWRLRATVPGRLLAGTFALSLVLVAAWGLWHGGFPQPSELGWL